MMFFDHGIQGGAIYAVPAKAVGAPWWIWLPLFAWGFWRGAKPDLDGLLLRGDVTYGDAIRGGEKIGRAMRLDITIGYSWGVYGNRHHSPSKFDRYEPAYRAHLEEDKPFHKVPGENWWPRLWPWATAIWIGEAAILLYLILR